MSSEAGDVPTDEIRASDAFFQHAEGERGCGEMESGGPEPVESCTLRYTAGSDLPTIVFLATMNIGLSAPLDLSFERKHGLTVG